MSESWFPPQGIAVNVRTSGKLEDHAGPIRNALVCSANQMLGSVEEIAGLNAISDEKFEVEGLEGQLMCRRMVFTGANGPVKLETYYNNDLEEVLLVLSNTLEPGVERTIYYWFEDTYREQPISGDPGWGNIYGPRDQLIEAMAEHVQAACTDTSFLQYQETDLLAETDAEV